LSVIGARVCWPQLFESAVSEHSTTGKEPVEVFAEVFAQLSVGHEAGLLEQLVTGRVVGELGKVATAFLEPGGFIAAEPWLDENEPALTAVVGIALEPGVENLKHGEMRFDLGWVASWPQILHGSRRGLLEELDAQLLGGAEAQLAKIGEVVTPIFTEVGRDNDAAAADEQRLDARVFVVPAITDEEE
jgi:hypothetical protein